MARTKAKKKTAKRSTKKTTRKGARKTTKKAARKPAKRSAKRSAKAAGGEIKKNKKGKFCVITHGNKAAFKGGADTRFYGCFTSQADAKARLAKVT